MQCASAYNARTRMPQAATMPYFIYKVFPARQFEYVDAHDQYRDARKAVRAMRAELTPTDKHAVRMVFASLPAEAERMLRERREERPLGEDE